MKDNRLTLDDLIRSARMFQEDIPGYKSTDERFAEFKVSNGHMKPGEQDAIDRLMDESVHGASEPADSDKNARQPSLDELMQQGKTGMTQEQGQKHKRTIRETNEGPVR